LRWGGEDAGRRAVDEKSALVESVVALLTPVENLHGAEGRDARFSLDVSLW
jgi:hypothetical protein